MEWIIDSSQNLLSLEKTMAFGKIYMVLGEDPNLVNLFKGRLTEDPTLDTAAKLVSRKMDILKKS